MNYLFLSEYMEQIDEEYLFYETNKGKQMNIINSISRCQFH